MLINLFQTTYFDGLTLRTCRQLHCHPPCLNIIFIRAIECSNMPSKGPVSLYKAIYSCRSLLNIFIICLYRPYLCFIYRVGIFIFTSQDKIGARGITEHPIARIELSTTVRNPLKTSIDLKGLIIMLSCLV